MVQLTFFILLYLIYYNTGVTSQRFHSNETKRKIYHFKVAALPSYPFVIWDSESKLPKITGVDIEILNILAEKLRFSYDAILPLELEYGVKNKNGIWTGMIGMVANNRTDIGLPNAFITNGRLKVVEFGSPYIYYTTNFIVRAPQQLSKIMAIIRPFDKNLWLWIFISLILLGIIMYGILYMESAIYYIHYNWSLSSIYWWIFAIFIGKSSNLENKLRNSRCIVGFSRLCFIALLSAYSGMLISHLSFPGYTSVLDKFEDLAVQVQRGEFECGSMKGTANEALFIDAREGLLELLGNIMSKDENRCVNMKQAVEKVLNRKYAFIFVSHLVKFYILKTGPEDYHLSQGIFSFPSSISLHRNFPLKKEFRKLILRMFEAGITDRFLSIEAEMINIKRKSHPHEEIIHLITVKDLIGAFILLGIGYAAAIICFIFEMLNTVRLHRNIMSNLIFFLFETNIKV